MPEEDHKYININPHKSQDQATHLQLHPQKQLASAMSREGPPKRRKGYRE